MNKTERTKDHARAKAASIAKLTTLKTPAGRLRVFLNDTIVETRALLKAVEAGAITFDDAHSYITHLHTNVEDIVAAVVDGVAADA